MGRSGESAEKSWKADTVGGVQRPKGDRLRASNGEDSLLRDFLLLGMPVQYGLTFAERLLLGVLRECEEWRRHSASRASVPSRGVRGRGDCGRLGGVIGSTPCITYGKREVGGSDEPRELLQRRRRWGTVSMRPATRSSVTSRGLFLMKPRDEDDS